MKLVPSCGLPMASSARRAKPESMFLRFVNVYSRKRSARARSVTESNRVIATQRNGTSLSDFTKTSSELSSLR